jgi:peptidylprolyl isomerase
MTSNRAALLLLAVATTALAQTTAIPPKKPATTAPTVHTITTHPATVATTVPACAKVPDLSPKIPALPAGLACPKALYTITIEPTAKLSYISPLESPDLAKSLNLEGTSFTLAYVDTKVGTGELAAPHKWYSIHYTGYLVDGTKFDSSLDRGEPINVQYGQRKVIIGWDTGFDGMRIGGKRRLFIPFQLAYGPQGKPPTIPAQAELIFDVELVAQSDTEPAPKRGPEPAKPPVDPTKPSDPTKPADSTQPTADPTKPTAEPAKP